MPKPVSVISAELKELIRRAEQGDTSTLPKLRQMLDTDPSIALCSGDVARQSEEVWVDLLAGTNLFLTETIRRKLVEWRTELGGPNPSPIERMLVEQATICSLQAHYADTMYA